jgi:hypothetical protein
MRRVIVSAVACVLGACASFRPTDQEPEVAQAYRDLVAFENRISEVRAIWKVSNERSEGEPPETTMKRAMRDIDETIRAKPVGSGMRPGPTGEQRKQYYLFLIRKFGIAASLLHTGLFSIDDLNYLSEKKGYESTELVRELAATRSRGR